jgi:hypothetical protein
VGQHFIAYVHKILLVLAGIVVALAAIFVARVFAPDGIMGDEAQSIVAAAIDDHLEGL